MKILLIIGVLLSLNCFNTRAQVIDNEPWCPSGAMWVYRLNIQYSEEYHVYNYIKDTLIDSKASKVIGFKKLVIFRPNLLSDQYYRHSFDLPNLYIRESNDSVFSYHQNQFNYIYKFNAEVGDTIVSNLSGYHPISFTDYPHFLVDDTTVIYEVSTKTISSRTFDYFKNYNYGRWDVGHIINKIGGELCLLPLPTHFNDNELYFGSGNGFLFYYRDDLRGDLVLNAFMTQMLEDNTSNLSFILSTDQNNQLIKEKFILYPNPSSSRLFITNAHEIASLQIIDISGKVLQTIKPESNEIDIKYLPEGIYHVRILSGDQITIVKFLKQ